jgi:hypothetical protein
MTTRSQPVNNRFSIHFERPRCVPEAAPHCRIILFSGQAATVDLLEKAPARSFFRRSRQDMEPEQLVPVIRGNVN